MVVTLTPVWSWISRYGIPWRRNGITAQRSDSASSSAGVHRSRKNARNSSTERRLSSASYSAASGSRPVSGWTDLRFNGVAGGPRGRAV